jgi:hypothetical protein
MNSNTTTAAIPESWPDLWKIDQPIDFEAFLRSDLLAAKHNHLKAIAIIVRTSGSISVVASIGLACHILRSHDSEERKEIKERELDLVPSFYQSIHLKRR